MAALVLVAAPLFSSFGRNPIGLIDAFRGLYMYEAETGHDKPWWYYPSILSGWERGKPFLGGEGLLFLSALTGASLSFVSKSLSRDYRLARYVSLIFGILILSISLFAYKTPWVLMVVLFPMSILSGFSANWLIERWQQPVLQAIAGLVLAIILSLTLKESLWTSRTFPSDQRNPYAYVHTSRDLLRLMDQTRLLADDNPDSVVKVIAEEYWPIPWYLRDLQRVGYWHVMPDDPYAPIMIVSAELSEELDPERMSAYVSGFRGLRPGKIMLLYHLPPEAEVEEMKP
jgi:predicted membrane-bound mannosyltransferase